MDIFACLHWSSLDERMHIPYLANPCGADNHCINQHPYLPFSAVILTVFRIPCWMAALLQNNHRGLLICHGCHSEDALHSLNEFLWLEEVERQDDDIMIFTWSKKRTLWNSWNPALDSIFLAKTWIHLTLFVSDQEQGATKWRFNLWNTLFLM